MNKDACRNDERLLFFIKDVIHANWPAKRYSGATEPLTNKVFLCYDSEGKAKGINTPFCKESLCSK